VLRRHRNVSVLMAEVTGFDLEAREVHCRQPDGRPLMLPYDSLVVAAGAGGSYFGHDEFAQWAPGMKTLDRRGPAAHPDPGRDGDGRAGGG
jgi:NADH dehydrogenase